MSFASLACSLVIPAHNEHRRMQEQRTLERYHHALASRFGNAFEIIVVANGCTDDTEAFLREATQSFPNLHTLSTTRPGKGLALRMGFAAAVGKTIVIADADASAPGEGLLLLLDALDTADMALGSRHVEGAHIEHRQPFPRRCIGRVGRMLIRCLFPFRCTDPLCGFKAFRHSSIAPLLDDCTEDSAAFDVELLLAAHRKGLRMEERPIRWSHVDRAQRLRWRQLLRWPVQLARLRIRSNGDTTMPATPGGGNR